MQIAKAIRTKFSSKPEKQAEHNDSPGEAHARKNSGADAKQAAARNGASGLNWQHCARMAFVGVTDSFEAGQAVAVAGAGALGRLPIYAIASVANPRSQSLYALPYAAPVCCHPRTANTTPPRMLFLATPSRWQSFFESCITASPLATAWR